jgi:predicted metal-dependent hydrolase
MQKIIEKPKLGPVRFIRSKRAKRLFIKISSHNGVRVSVPSGISYETAEKIVMKKVELIQHHQKIVKRKESECRAPDKLLRQIDIKNAVEKLVSRLQYWVKRYNFTFNRVTIRNQKTRWGSCSMKNNINLNINLVNLPDELMDYVIIHELVHTRHKNHGPLFWKELNYLVGDARQLSRQLRKYRPGPIAG